MNIERMHPQGVFLDIWMMCLYPVAKEILEGMLRLKYLLNGYLIRLGDTHWRYVSISSSIISRSIRISISRRDIMCILQMYTWY